MGSASRPVGAARRGSPAATLAVRSSSSPVCVGSGVALRVSRSECHSWLRSDDARPVTGGSRAGSLDVSRERSGAYRAVHPATAPLPSGALPLHAHELASPPPPPPITLARAPCRRDRREAEASARASPGVTRRHQASPRRRRAVDRRIRDAVSSVAAPCHPRGLEGKWPVGVTDQGGGSSVDPRGASWRMIVLLAAWVPGVTHEARQPPSLAAFGASTLQTAR